MVIIGLTGLSGSGKDIVASYLKDKGFAYYSLSDIVREECQKRGLETYRDNLIEIANQLRAEHGPTVLARRTLAKIRENRDKDAVVVSIRNPSEVEELKKEPSFRLISVTAPVELRYQRISSRGRPEDAVSLEKFKEQEEREMAGSATQQQLRKVMGMADYTVVNEGTREELEKWVAEILKSIT